MLIFRLLVFGLWCVCFGFVMSALLLVITGDFIRLLYWYSMSDYCSLEVLRKVLLC